ncbi:hypothetical protein BH23ACT12_BH23ACT12_10700 [soil metagenome]
MLSFTEAEFLSEIPDNPPSLRLTGASFDDVMHPPKLIQLITG